MMSSVGKVFVAMSGGVDSSVAAALLKRQGYDVTGVFIKTWSPENLGIARPEDLGISCTETEDRQDAMRVCALLDVPFLTFDFEKEYKREVVDYMIAEYRAGRTPNPDVMCNTKIKFGAFFDKAREMGADYIATGHYARIQKSKIKNQNEKSKFKNGFFLRVAKDTKKDQTYFLWTLTQDILAHTLFPIGEYEKPNVRRMAAEIGLPTATKKDSQGLCFIGKLDMKEFLKNFIDEKPGDVLDESGRVIGRHDGALFYTLLERHGFHINPRSPSEKPYYIVSKDVEHNTITVSTDPTPKLDNVLKDDVLLQNTNWIAGEPPHPDQLLSARSRYRGDLFGCFVRTVDAAQYCARLAPQPNPPAVARTHCAASTHARVMFPNTRPILPSGQSLVFYRGDETYGGGVIS